MADDGRKADEYAHFPFGQNTSLGRKRFELFTADHRRYYAFRLSAI